LQQRLKNRLKKHPVVMFMPAKKKKASKPKAKPKAKAKKKECCPCCSCG